ncbi:MotA/TolQ/ExbB proton channel family protein [Botrimarina hoheduenensis]|uniref:MotA/TolQ/ExbB proton channel family protein n=1 Tax=Botrimarina hoheduenensis TaxID=2528000 RepID=A0A5C5VVF1_9BACT|nr:MotA/TolQ/ExbB proton channel family protein [Botrimarina hoheduenensis]TWT42558.1 MotA/TolQ/ExbB proton channel family protein [Botrimarina hoheduenensis]
MSQVTGLANWFLRLPLVWASLATLAFYAAITSGWIGSPLIERYFAAHPVEWVSTLLFALGAAALTIRFGGLVGQYGVLESVPLGDRPAAGQPVSEAATLLARLDRMPIHLRGTYLVRRLRDALAYVNDVGTADSLEDQLDRLNETAREQMNAGYAAPRLMRATLPIVGMLGTVIGITMAIGQLSPEALEQSLTSVMGSLSIAFDTTAQAMSLMLALWFVQFGVERLEERLLDRVHDETSKALLGRFHQYGAANDPNVASIRRMGEQVISAVDHLTAQQAETWRMAIDATQSRWSDTMAAAGELMVNTLRQGLTENLRLHGEGITSKIEQQLAQIGQSVSDQTAAIDTATRVRIEKLTDIESQHTARLTAADKQHTDRLAEGADRLLGNLREGLERMAELLVEALQRHGEVLTEAEGELASENRRHLSEVEAALGESMVVAADRQEKLIRQSERLLKDMQESLVAAAGATVQHQEQLVKQGEVLLRVVESTGQVRQLEESLNRNLATLGRTHNFEETLMSLSAAIQLLSVRAGVLDSKAPKSHAA